MRDGRKCQEDEAKALLRRAGLGGMAGPCGPVQWQQVHKALMPRYGLRIWRKDYCNRLAFNGEGSPDRRLDLYFYEGHFCVITRLAPFLNKGYACEECGVGFQTASTATTAREGATTASTRGSAPKRSGSFARPATAGSPPLSVWKTTGGMSRWAREERG